MLKVAISLVISSWIRSFSVEYKWSVSSKWQLEDESNNCVTWDIGCNFIPTQRISGLVRFDLLLATYSWFRYPRFILMSQFFETFSLQLLFQKCPCLYFFPCLFGWLAGKHANSCFPWAKIMSCVSAASCQEYGNIYLEFVILHEVRVSKSASWRKLLRAYFFMLTPNFNSKQL